MNDIGDFKKKEKKKNQEEILSSLSKSDGSKYISQVSDDTGLARQTASKHLKELREKGEVEKKTEIGTAKLYDIK